MNSIKIGTASKLINLTRPSLLIHDLQKPWWRQILDPGGEYVNKWNRIFLFTSLVALFLDPLFLLLPRTADSVCMMMDFPLGVTLTSLRSIVDLFSFLHIAMKFRTAYVAPSSRVFGRGELVTDPRKIAIRYLKSDLIFDLVAALPLPQVVIWFIIPAVKRITTAAHANHTISYVIILQYVPRLFVIFPLSKRITKTTGVLAKTAWAGAAYNLLLYTLSSHILGAFWYFLSVDHQYSCWRRECLNERLQKGLPRCDTYYLDCNYLSLAGHEAWMNTTNVYRKCNAQSPLMLGMFSDAFTEGVASALFFDKYFYCLWWGLKSLSSYGQSLATSTDIKETMFSSLICILGLVLFSLLIGDMQTYLQSTTRRLEEWRVKRRDTEEWMRHRQLPPELQDRVRKFVQYKWLATRGVDEEDILRSLPLDLRRQIQRHLCLSLVRRVPFFSQMDDQLLDAICERLVSSLNTKDTYVVREGDPVNDMLFVIRGQLESSTTNGGRSGFFNSITLKPGDFCGEELLTWALMPASNHNLPSSTRTVRCLSEVEAFALRAEDLKFVASQFKRLHSKKLQHAFRYYSHQWRTWGACFVQSAWRRYQRKKMAEDLARQEESYYYTRISDPEEDSDCDREFTGNSGSEKNRQQVGVGATMLASKFAANTRRGVVQKVVETPGLKMPKLLKPDEPDFSADDQVD